MSLKDWEKLDITQDEVKKIENALKNEEFRKLLVEYCEEISDPVNKQKYEEEITQMENERGIDVTFVHPHPGYVIKTSSNGKLKTFINVASNELIEKPQSERTENNKGEKGSSWSIPYSLAPPRPDQDNRGAVCHVYDVVFHPMVLDLTNKNNAFRDLVNKTAVNAVQDAFNVELDACNLKFPKLKYKGVPKPAVIRKKSENPPTEHEPSPIDKYYPPAPPPTNVQKSDVIDLKEHHPVSKYTSPKFQIVERHNIELNNESDMKHDMDKPKELSVTIDLPLLNSTQDVNLDVTDNMIYLLSEHPAKYKIEIKLPCKVNEKMGNAKFDKTKRQLLITLPTIVMETNNNKIQHSNDALDTANENNNDVEVEVKGAFINDEPYTKNDGFLDKSIEYLMPSFSFNQIDSTVAFTLNVKNCGNDSIEIQKFDDEKMIHIKFCTIGSGYYPIYYSFCAQLPSEDDNVLINDFSAEAWDNNVILQLELTDSKFSYYFAGLSPNDMTKYEVLEKPTAYNIVALSNENDHSNEEIEEKSDDEEDEDNSIEIKGKNIRDHTSNDEISEDVFDNANDKANLKKMKKSLRRRNNKKMRSLSESHCDVLKIIESSRQEDNNGKKLKEITKKVRSLSESSSDEHIHNAMSIDAEKLKARKGILKHRSYDRCVSECTDSDYMRANNESLSYCDSMEFGISHDSLSERKTVRFNDNIKRQLFRSNTSILAQKKKNQKKKASRRRNRSHSEGSEDFDDKASSIDSEIKNDSGVDFDDKIEKLDNDSVSPPRSADVEFKSGFIFDLEI